MAVALAASEGLVRALDRLGARLGLQEALLGLLTALGADAPEIASAVLAARAGAPELGAGVVLGSNLFNLAALLGLAALVAGRVRVRRAGLAVTGGVALLATALAASLLLGALAPPAEFALLVALCGPYVVLLATPPPRVARLPLPDRLARLLAAAVGEIGHEAHGAPAAAPSGRAPSWRSILPAILVALALIVAASDGMVAAALGLAAAWRLPRALVGALALAGLTSVPNAYAAVRLARHRRGSAVVSEAFNSNTINLLVGLGLPALFLGTPIGGSLVGVDLLWLAGMTGIGIALLARRDGLGRPGGALLVALYAGYVLVRLRLG